MELREGYKQTEVGAIPEDWDIQRLHSLVRHHNAGVYKKKELYGEGCNIVGVSNLYEINYISDQEFGRVPLSDEELKHYSLTENDLLYAESSLVREGIARTVYVTKSGDDIAFAWHTRRYSVDQNVLLSKYLYYYLQSRPARKHMMDKSIQTALTGINTTEYFSCPIPLPPTKTEQTAIATALSDTDSLIESLEKLIAKKRNIKKGAMQRLLTPKEGWEVKKLGVLLDYEQPTNYLVLDSEYDDKYLTPVLTAGKTFMLGYTDEDFGVFSKLPVIIFDDFTTASKFVDFPFKAKSSAMKMLVPKNDNISLRFIYETIQRIHFPLGDHKRHWIGEFQHISISVPNPAEQTRIATILSDMDNEIATLETKLNKYKMIKQGMMQNLLTGKIRLV